MLEQLQEYIDGPEPHHHPSVNVGGIRFESSLGILDISVNDCSQVTYIWFDSIWEASKS